MHRITIKQVESFMCRFMDCDVCIESYEEKIHTSTEYALTFYVDFLQLEAENNLGFLLWASLTVSFMWFFCITFP